MPIQRPGCWPIALIHIYIVDDNLLRVDSISNNRGSSSGKMLLLQMFIPSNGGKSRDRRSRIPAV
jgi:hypothetical protein